MAMRTKQAKQTRRALALRGVAAVAGWSVLFAALAATALPALWQKAAYVFADVTSPWVYVTEDEYAELQQGSPAYVQQYGDNNPAVAVYCCGVVAIALVMGNRALKRLDDLSAAVTGLFADRFAPIELPDDLSVARADLVQIQNRALSDERTAKAAEVRKNELVAYLAHDIRTPLTSVVGYLSILKETPELPVADRAKLAGIALEKAERLEGLVGEFFEITRYDLQAIPIERERVGIALFLRQVADELYPEAKARSVSIEVSAPEDASAFIDPEKMARAVSNVLRNAVAFADRESVVDLCAEVEGGSVTMRVIDTGKEISPAHLDAIFEKFFREDGARSSERGGAGLGLAIAREIVEAHGGTMWAESSLGRTVFTIAIPEKAVPPQ